MNSLGTIKSALSDSLISNSALKEAFDIASFVTDRTTRFKDVAFNSDQKHKLRRILNHFLTPSIKPKFVDDEDFTSHDDGDVPDDWLAKADDDVKLPFRMIDVDTMNMVPTYSLGLQDQYCIVSHSWKGSEITYGYFGEAKTFEPKEDFVQDDSSLPSSDVSNVVSKCKSDIAELEAKIESALQSVRPRADGQKPEDIKTLLEWYIDANGAEYGLGSSQRALHDASSGLSSATREAKYYRSLWETINTLTAENSSTPESEASQKNPEMEEVDSAILKLETEAEERRKSAETRFQKASVTRAEADGTIKFFDHNRELCYGIEALLVALQRIRSSRKILESIAQSKKLFDAHFPKGGKRYVWLDTCCINKADSYELTESLALMGDWYINADLCLVHVDTPRSESSWIEEWKYWKDPSHVPVPLNMVEFDQIGADGANEEEKANNQVEWATRGWTLQELVLSKVTYYVNSHWQNLVRPIEVIGPLYFLRPFIQRYLCHPFVKKFKTTGPEVLDTLKELLSPTYLKEGMTPEHELAVLLQILGFAVPRGLKEKTAEAQIGKAVLAASGQLPAVLEDLIAKESVSDASSLTKLREKEGHLIDKIAVFNHLLGSIVGITDSTILEDRKFIARFSKVENMKNWIVGDGLLDSSASTSLITASQRVTTVPTDQAYSLMGILGVRFPAFPAEGLPKALSRLLDEVVIAYNDVSVFNWTGKHRGSPLHGRSLYPSNIDAFVDPANNPKIMSQAQTSKRILDLFRAQRVRQSETASNVNMLLAEMLALTKKLPEQCSVFVKLSLLATKVKQVSFDKLEAHIGELKGIVSELRDFTPKEEDPVVQDNSLAGRLGSGLDRMDSFSKSVMATKFETPKFEVPKMSFGWKKGGAKAVEKEQPSEPVTPVTPSVPEPAPAPPVDQYEHLNNAIQQVIDVLSDKVTSQLSAAKELPLDVKPETANVEIKTQSLEEQEEKRMVCPNPIVVSSGGIRGIFDIQRIIVTMVEPEVLRSRVRTAVRGQMIDGWCTISTGLSMTLVAFSCERDVLAQQLDLAEVIKTYLEPEDPATPEEKKKEKETDEEKKKNEGFFDQINLKKTPEQAKLARMISFVQKQTLEGIAGEWVLARFSGVPNASWFLCLLELGAGNDFYGRRIATDAFSFEDAAPEQGLTEYWHQFTMEKKARTCDTLDMYLNRQKMWQAAGGQLDQLQKVENPSQGQGKEGIQGDLETAWEIVQNVSLDKVVNLGKMTGLGIGGLGAQLWADHLEGRIEKGALKRVPVPLRTPVRDLDHNRKLLPAMFHAGREMHMF
ncbi:hypothetical protein N7540_002824 [Penicillium herquei]|nr:hypothetical protein N7540_002824 [Penicillium herquei]